MLLGHGQHESPSVKCRGLSRCCGVGLVAAVGYRRAGLRGAVRVVGSGSPAPDEKGSSSKISSPPKSGAWKGSVAGGGETAVERRGCPSRAENSEVWSMRVLPFVAGP